MIDSFRQTLIDYVLSGHAYLHAHTPEKIRFVQELKEVATELPPNGRPIFVWSPAVGWQDADGNPATTASGAELGQPNPQTAPQQILELPEEALFVLKDFGCYLQSRTFAYFDIVLAWLSEIRDVLAHTGRTVIFVGVDFDIPPALQHDVTTIEFKLPNDAAIEKAVRFVGEDHPIDEASMPALVTACRGMTQQQVEDRTALALRKFKKLNGEAARLILNEKAEVIRRTGLLDYRDPPEGGLDIIGGWENVKKHVQLDKPCFAPEARQFGIEFPRGLLLGRSLRRRQDADELVHRQLPGPAAHPAGCRQPHEQVGRRVRAQHARGHPPTRRPRLVRPATGRDREGLWRCRR